MANENFKKYDQDTRPTFIYGTAWKENETASLVKLAMASGFSAIDTANQKKHYREDLVGQALEELFAKGLERSSIWLQSKFTYEQGQDHRMPYDPSDSYSEQVKASFENTLENLGVAFLDSYLLHGPLTRNGMIDGDWEVWKAMEEIYDSGKVNALGLSNVSPIHLMEVIDNCRVMPTYVQNRCFALTGWDREIRQICTENDIAYQGFSLLTANRPVLEDAQIEHIAQNYGATASQVIFQFTRQVGMIPITGTTSAEHMREDLEENKFELSPSEVQSIESLAEAEHT